MSDKTYKVQNSQLKWKKHRPKESEESHSSFLLSFDSVEFRSEKENHIDEKWVWKWKQIEENWVHSPNTKWIYKWRGDCHKNKLDKINKLTKIVFCNSFCRFAVSAAASAFTYMTN